MHLFLRHRRHTADNAHLRSFRYLCCCCCCPHLPAPIAWVPPSLSAEPGVNLWQNCWEPRSSGSPLMGQRRRLAGSRILITGASQGIGRALAVAAVQRGARVVAVARSADLLRELAEEVRSPAGALETVVADITQPADRRQ